MEDWLAVHHALVDWYTNYANEEGEREEGGKEGEREGEREGEGGRRREGGRKKEGEREIISVLKTLEFETHTSQLSPLLQLILDSSPLLELLPDAIDLLGQKLVVLFSARGRLKHCLLHFHGILDQTSNTSVLESYWILDWVDGLHPTERDGH